MARPGACLEVTEGKRCVRRGDHDVHRTRDGIFWAVRKVERTYLEALGAEWEGRRR